MCVQWPQMSFLERLNAIEAVIQDLETNQREKMVHVLMWEIGKNRKDAEAEFDRTMQFGRELMRVMHGIHADGSDAPHDDEFGGTWKSIGPTMAFVRRAAIGIILCLGPMNYPLNETYATLIPALLMGNSKFRHRQRPACIIIVRKKQFNNFLVTFEH